MADEQTEKSSEQYSGYGWSFVRFRNVPDWISAPLAIAGGLILVVLFGVGVSLIYKLVERVWSGAGADTASSQRGADRNRRYFWRDFFNMADRCCPLASESEPTASQDFLGKSLHETVYQGCRTIGLHARGSAARNR